MSKINRNADSYYVNEKDIDTKSVNLQNVSPVIPDKSVYTPIISILIQSTENSLIHHLIITKLKKNSSNLKICQYQWFAFRNDSTIFEIKSNQIYMLTKRKFYQITKTKLII